jgi:hypothetical protein
VHGINTSVDEFRRYGAPHVAGIAVVGIAEACIPDPDERLHDLLVDVIAECATFRDVAPATTPEVEVLPTSGSGRRDR